MNIMSFLDGERRRSEEVGLRRDVFYIFHRAAENVATIRRRDSIVPYSVVEGYMPLKYGSDIPVRMEQYPDEESEVTALFTGGNLTEINDFGIFHIDSSGSERLDEYQIMVRRAYLLCSVWFHREVIRGLTGDRPDGLP